MAAPLADSGKAAASSDGSGSGNSLFKTQCPSLPTRKPRRRSERGSALVPTLAGDPRLADGGDSSDSEAAPVCPPSFLRSGGFKKRREKGGKARGPVKSSRRSGRPSFASAKRVQHRGLEFPFVQKVYGQKDLPLKMILNYEQASLCGIFDYIKEMKHQKELKLSLRKIDKRCVRQERFEIKQYGYLEEKRAVTPIDDFCEEGCAGDFETEERLGVKVVDNSCFIRRKRRKSHTREAERQRKKIPNEKGEQGEGVKATRSSKRSRSNKHKTKCAETEDQSILDSGLAQSVSHQKSSNNKSKLVTADPQQEPATEGSRLRKHSKRKHGHPETTADTQGVTTQDSALQRKSPKRRQKNAEADKQHGLLMGASVSCKRPGHKDGRLKAEAETQDVATQESALQHKNSKHKRKPMKADAQGENIPEGSGVLERRKHELGHPEAETQEDVTKLQSPLQPKSSKHKSKRAETDKRWEPVTEGSILTGYQTCRNGQPEAKAKAQEDVTMLESPLRRKRSKRKSQQAETDKQHALVTEELTSHARSEGKNGQLEAEAETQDVATLQTPLQHKSSKRKSKQAKADKQKELITEPAILPECQKHEHGHPEAEMETQDDGTTLESALQRKSSHRKLKPVKANPREELATGGAVSPKRKEPERGQHQDATPESIWHHKKQKHKKKRAEADKPHTLVTEAMVMCKRSDNKRGHPEAEAETQEDVTTLQSTFPHKSSKRKPKPMKADAQQKLPLTGLSDHSKGKRVHLEAETQPSETMIESPLQHTSSKDKHAEADKQHRTLVLEESVFLGKHKKRKSGQSEPRTQEGVTTLDSPSLNNCSKYKPTKADPREELVTEEEAILPECKKHKDANLEATLESPLQHKSSKHKDKRAKADRQHTLLTEGSVSRERSKRKHSHPEAETQDVTTREPLLPLKRSKHKHKRAKADTQPELLAEVSVSRKHKKHKHRQPEAEPETQEDMTTLQSPLHRESSKRKHKGAEADKREELEAGGPVLHELSRGNNGLAETETREDAAALAAALHNRSSKHKNRHADKHKGVTKESSLPKHKKHKNGHSEIEALERLAVEQETLGNPLLDPPGDENNGVKAGDAEQHVTAQPPANKHECERPEVDGQGELAEEQDKMAILSYFSLSPTRPQKVTEAAALRKRSKPGPKQAEELPEPATQDAPWRKPSRDEDGPSAEGVSVKRAKASRAMEPNAPSGRRKRGSKLERASCNVDSLGSDTRHHNGRVEENGEEEEEEVVGLSTSATRKKDKKKYKKNLYFGSSCFTGSPA